MSVPQKPPDLPALEKSTGQPSGTDSPIRSSSFRPQSDGVLSDISASASSLLGSLINPPASSATSSLASSPFTISATKSDRPQYSLPSSSTQPSGSLSPNSVSATSGSNVTREIRSQQPILLNSFEDEFNAFAKPPTELSTRGFYPSVSPSNCYNLYPDVAEDGLDVTSLLSQPLTSELYSSDLEFHGMNSTHPIIRTFLSCGDPVEFLTITNEYTEEVWGEYVEVVRQAWQEISNDKGKGKQDVNRTATARLKMIWGQLKGAVDSRSQ